MGAFDEAWSVVKAREFDGWDRMDTPIESAEKGQRYHKCETCKDYLYVYKNKETKEIKNGCRCGLKGTISNRKHPYPTRNDFPHGMKGGYH